MKDLLIYETGSGGDIKLISGDIALSNSFLSQVYIAFFGGNKEANTTGNEIDGEERLDYWGNIFLKGNKQFNSNFERALNTTVYNSAGRITLENEAKKDLAIFDNISNYEVNISIISDSRIRVEVLIYPNNPGSQQLNFIWDQAKQEVIIEETI